jgi:predicted transcriptional regulator
MCSQSHETDVMKPTILTVRVDSAVKKRVERLAKTTGRSRSLLATEAINAYLDVNDWQVAGIEQAIASLDRSEGIAHDAVKDWVASWSHANEKPAPKRS